MYVYRWVTVLCLCENIVLWLVVLRPWSHQEIFHTDMCLSPVVSEIRVAVESREFSCTTCI